MIKYKKIALIIGATILSVYLLFAVTYYAVTSKSYYCKTCHLIKPYVPSWKEYPHKNVSCMYCHEERGFVGKFDSQTRGINHLYQRVTGQYTVLNQGIVFEENCLYCHLGDNKQFPDSPRLTTKTINHFEVLREGTACLDCHDEVGHKNNFYINPELKKLWK
ncbi:MAG: NapC/NirT family cytochrome c [Bacillota bacterium]